MKVFLIDDNTIDLLISRKLLLKYDDTLEVREFNRASKAITVLRDESEDLPDLILLDLNMPGMTGWDFLEAIQDMDRQPKRIYILTSSLDERDRLMAAKYPAVRGYITKPLNNPSISQALS